jgi:hypothetical protein
VLFIVVQRHRIIIDEFGCLLVVVFASLSKEQGEEDRQSDNLRSAMYFPHQKITEIKEQDIDRDKQVDRMLYRSSALVDAEKESRLNIRDS